MNIQNTINQYNKTLEKLIAVVAEYMVCAQDCKKIQVTKKYAFQLAKLRQPQIEPLMQTIADLEQNDYKNIKIYNYQRILKKYQQFCESVLQNNDYDKIAQSLLVWKKHSILTMLQHQKELFRLKNEILEIDNNFQIHLDNDRHSQIYNKAVDKISLRHTDYIYCNYHCSIAKNLLKNTKTVNIDTIFNFEYLFAHEYQIDTSDIIHQCKQEDNQIPYLTFKQMCLDYLQNVISDINVPIPLLDADIDDESIIDIVNNEQLSSDDLQWYEANLNPVCLKEQKQMYKKIRENEDALILQNMMQRATRKSNIKES